MNKRKLILLSLPIVVIVAIFVAGVIFLSPGKTQAAMSDTSAPSVTVANGGSLTVSPTGMAYGSKAAGTHTAYTDDGGHKVQLQIDTNTTTWDVKVSKDHDLTKGGDTIPSTGFIYSSVYVSGTPNPPDVYGPLQFGTVGSPSNVTDTPGTPAAAVTLVVDVRYDLTIPPTQATGAYSATHTYTLTAS